MKRLILSLMFVSGVSYGAYFLYEYGGGTNEIVVGEGEDPVKKFCTEIYNKISNTKKCQEKQELFNKHREECKAQFVMAQDEFSAFNELGFAIANCFRNNNQRAQYEAMLSEIAKGHEWKREGPTDCPVVEEAQARLEATQYPDSTCTKDSDLGSWVDTSIDISPDQLKQMASQDHPVRFGTWESDDSCILPFTKFAETIGNIRGLKVVEVEKAENEARYVHFANDQRRTQVVLGFVEEDSCLVLDGVYIPAGGLQTF